MEQNNINVSGEKVDLELDVPEDQIEEIVIKPKKVRKPRTKTSDTAAATVTETISDVITAVSEIHIENKPKKRITPVADSAIVTPWPINLADTGIEDGLNFIMTYDVSNELKTMLQDYIQVVLSGTYDSVRMQAIFTSLVQYYRRLVAIVLYNSNKTHVTSAECNGIKTFLDTVCYKNRLILESGNISCTMKTNSISTIHNMKNVGDFCFFQDLPAMNSVETIQPNISSIVTDLYVIWCLCIINIDILNHSEYNEELFPVKTTKTKNGSTNETKKDMKKMFIEKILLLSTDTAQPQTKYLFGVISRKKKVTPKAGANDISIADALTTATIQDMIGQSLEGNDDVLIDDDEDECEMPQEEE